MNKIPEAEVLNKYALSEKIKKTELLRLMKVPDVNSRTLPGSKGSGKAAGAVPRRRATGSRLSQATLGLLREYFAICLALRRVYNGVEGIKG